jgi:DNA polymerase-3 subunit alpha
MGFAGYFLIVADFINWAKTHGVPWARGAARARARWWRTRSASPTSDPLRYDLLFERFLNPERVSMPTSTSTSARTGATA